MKLPFLLSLLATAVFVSCEDSQTSRNHTEKKNAEILALQEKLENLHNELEAEEGGRAKLVAKYDLAIEALQSSIVELDSKLKVAKEIKEEKPVEIPKTVVVSAPPKEEEQAEETPDDVDVEAIRKAAIGETYGKLELNGGQVYHDVRITGVDDIGVKFSHRNGAARIDFMKLPTSWRERFHFNMSRFLDARKSERLAQHRWEKAVDEKLAEIREKKKKVADEKRIAELERALDEAKRPIQVTQVSSTQTRRSGSSLLAGYSTSLYPTVYSFGLTKSSYRHPVRRTSSWGSSYCPPVIRTNSGSSSVSTPYCPPVRTVTRTPLVSAPTIRPSRVVCPTPAPTPVTRAPVIRPTVQPRYHSH